MQNNFEWNLISIYVMYGWLSHVAHKYDNNYNLKAICKRMFLTEPMYVLY